jgi:hypothetical protein
LQKDIKDMLYDRPLAATSDYFKGKFVKVDGVPTQIDAKIANGIEFYLIANGYVDMDADYGILPIPKYNADQEDYLSNMYYGTLLMTIPTVCATPERTAAVMDALGATVEKTAKLSK